MLSENDLELLSAYLDGALSEVERTALETRLQSDAELRRELARLRATVELVKSLPTLNAPRSLTLTPRMVRRPTVWLSTSFSALSAAAAVILLVIGAALFTTPGNPASAVTAARAHQVALVPTSVDLFAVTSSADQSDSGGGIANSPQITSQKQATPQSQDGQLSDALRFASPTETVAAPLALSVAQPSDTETPLVEQGYSANAQESVPNLQSDTDQAVAPSAMNGVASAAQAPIPVESATSTLVPTITPSLTSTSTSTNTSTSIPTNTATSTDTPTPTPLPALQETTPPETSTEGVGLIVAALVLFALAAVTTILRRNAR